jgi:hypothetical protein
MNRRDFIQNTVAGAFAATAQVSEAAPPVKMIGIQVGAVSFVDEGVENVLDTFQADAAVNTLFVATFTYGRGIAGRQVPGQLCQITGSANMTLTLSTAAAIRKFIRSITGIRHSLTFAHPSSVITTCSRRCCLSPETRHEDDLLVEDVFRGDLPNIDKLQEKELSGRNTTTLCFNNPNYRNWLLGVVEDYARSYEIDGIMWGSERQGALSNALGASPRWGLARSESRNLLLQLLREQGQDERN